MKQTMKTFHIFLLFVFFQISAHSQIGWLDPSPSDWNQEVTIFIDVNMSGSSSFDALREILLAHPESMSDVHIWIWQPAEPFTGNGSWSNSNDALLMTWVTDLIFSFTFVPAEFFNVDQSQFNSLGISCLAKLDNGSAYSNEFAGEAKTEDIHINVVTSVESIESGFPSLDPYPNPANSVVHITSMTQEIRSIRLHDITGRLILSHNSPYISNDTGIAIDVSTFDNGLYFLLIDVGKNCILKKIEIRKG